METPPQPPTPEPHQVVCECGHRVGDHYLQFFHPELCNGSLDCKCKLNQNEVTLESELTRLKSACAKEYESVQKLDEENQRLKELLTDWRKYYNEQGRSTGLFSRTNEALK